jgi:hypothetical protein
MRSAILAAAVILVLVARLAGQDMVRETLPTDIQTADYYELVAWCRTLGLPETGSRADLQTRLYAHYRVSPAPESARPARVIVVENARSTEYFTLEGAVKEDYLVLQGDVRVEFRDTTAGVSHRVSAERLVVNQTRRTLSASGGVTYELKRKTGASELFRGETFTFDLKGWGGLIVDGRGQSEREMVEGQPPITFFYRGQTIVRRENETVILHDGSVTSSVADDPYWQIAASRMWVLGPGEWAIRDGALEVGRVPLFYVPFLYHPGDEIVFHPSVGYRNREGSFIQTTTYLIGAAERKPTTLSFLRITGDDENYDTQLEGIFLHKVPRKEGTPAPAGGSASAPSGTGASPQQTPAAAGAPAGGAADKDIFKVMVDYYSRLGGFAGVLAVFDPVFTFKGGIGITRTLFESSGIYSPFDTESGKTTSDWNTVDVVGVTVPFRYGGETSLSLTSGAGSLQASISLFSDPYFPSDFYTRAERMDWTALLAGPDEASAAVEPGSLDPSVRESLAWTLTGRYKIAPAPPRLSSVEVQRVDLAVYWQGEDNPGIDADDPARRFFEPTRLVSPDLRLRVAGTLYKTAPPAAPAPVPAQAPTAAGQAPTAAGQAPTAAAAGAGATKPAATDPELRVVPPEAEEQPPPRSELRLPGALPDLPGLDLTVSPRTFELGYSFEPRVFLESQFNSAAWNTPDAVDLEFYYSSLELSGTQKLQTVTRLWDERFEARVGLNVEGAYRTRFNRSEDVPDSEWTSLRNNDYVATRLTIGPGIDLSLLPLAGVPSLSKTRLTYGLSWDVLNLGFEQSGIERVYRQRMAEWSGVTVDKNELAGRLNYQPGTIVSFLDLRTDLPPRPIYYRGETDFTVAFAKTNVKTGYRETTTGWVYDPLVVTETLDPVPWTQFQSRFEADLNEREIDRSDNTLRLVRLPVSSAPSGWLFEQRVVLNTLVQPVSLSQTTLSALGFTAKFLAERRDPVEFDINDGFVTTGAAAALVPAEASLAYKAPAEPLFAWHNRIRVVPVVSSLLLFDLYRFTGSRFEITAGLKASIYRFVDLDLSVTSYNNKLYRYIKPWAEEVGQPQVDPLDDLLASYAFFDRGQREASAFKLKSISLKATHDLGDWDLSAEYSGTQKLTAKDSGGEEYVWTPVFSIVIEWKPIPQIRREVARDATGLLVRG